MNKFLINIGDDILFTKDDSAQIAQLSSTFYIEYQNRCFPDNQWTDLTATILNMWTYKILKYKYNFPANYTLYFMDGAYRLDIQKTNNEILRINCVNFKEKDFIEFSFQCSQIDLFEVLYNANKRLQYFLYIELSNNKNYKKIIEQLRVNMSLLKDAIHEVKI